ncbi:hypothetical protein [Emticicia sp. BO119]|uniref:hypothetical protein n=1 Tax=Emticicia sp. BO119 TaxID=2757768 RepID=UPI0015F08BF8|nr:hypothetical protein [Emticicia sp. BO119]MBA4849463.1 hypothetical protein [Emticicia sp. BO119]
MKNLETFEAATISLGIDPTILPQVEGIEPGHGKAITSQYKLYVISQAAWKAEGKLIDWNDYDQAKYYPWFDMENSSGSGSGFAFAATAALTRIRMWVPASCIQAAKRPNS